MKKSVKEKEIKTAKAAETCHHYWVIDVANGPSSLGKCKYCGEKKEFLNAFPSFNPLRKSSNPLALPHLPKMEMDKQAES